MKKYLKIIEDLKVIIVKKDIEILALDYENKKLNDMIVAIENYVGYLCDEVNK